MTEIRIKDLQAHEKNTLRAFFVLELPSGMIIDRVMLPEKGTAGLVGLPLRERTDQAGKRQFTNLMTLTNRPAADRFRDLIVSELDSRLAATSQHARMAATANQLPCASGEQDKSDSCGHPCAYTAGN